MKKVIIFGSTGSVGRNALDIIRKDKKHFEVLGLCARKEIKMLSSQAREFSPRYLCITDESRADSLRKAVGPKTKLFAGEKGLEEFSSLSSDISLMAISGISCLKPLLINLKHTKRIALANKEALTVAGSFIFPLAAKFNTEIIPVDSEISALFQLLKRKDKALRRVYLTASGGALLNCTKRELKNIVVEKVLSHPTWRMGKRITVDSATLVNKGFEVIEAHYFFNLPYDKIGILLHRQSLVHALVELEDNTSLACLYPPDMRIPISSALYYPADSSGFGRDTFKKSIVFSFEPFKLSRFPLLKIILEAAGKGDNSLVVLNACDEVAVDYFLRKKIRFTDLSRVLSYIFRHYRSEKIKSIGDLFYWDRWARLKTEEYLARI